MLKVGVYWMLLHAEYCNMMSVFICWALLYAECCCVLNVFLYAECCFILGVIICWLLHAEYCNTLNVFICWMFLYAEHCYMLNVIHARFFIVRFIVVTPSVVAPFLNLTNIFIMKTFWNFLKIGPKTKSSQIIFHFGSQSLLMARSQ